MKTKIYGTLKYLSIITGVLGGLVQIGVFERCFELSDFSFLVLLYGYMYYFMFFDAGLSKPIYSKVRKAFIKNEIDKKQLQEFIGFYVFLILVVLILFLGFLLCLSKIHENTFSILVLLMFAIFSSLNIGLSFQKNILDAVDEYVFYEKIDLIRRIMNCITVFLIIIDHSMRLMLLVNILISSILVFCCLKKLISLFSLSWKKTFQFKISIYVKTIKENFNEGRDFLLFSLSEMITYNSGFLILPFFGNEKMIIIYGLWMRIYRGMALIVRAVADIIIHNITKSYFEKNLDSVNTKFSIGIFISIFISVGLASTFFLAEDLILSIWVGGSYDFAIYLNICLLVMLLFNGIQHLSGNFLLCTGGKFALMRNISLLFSIFTFFTFIFSLFILRRLGEALLVWSFSYSLGAIVYYQKAKKEIEVCSYGI